MRLTMWFGLVLVLLLVKTYADGKLTSTSDSGVCFYGKTAERVLSILATGKYRSLLPSGPHVRDCSDLDRKHYKSGVYKIFPAGGAGFKAYCDMETDGGGWTVFQRRQDGKVDFYRGWEDYVNGFGHFNTEFWLGNDKLYKLTSRGQYELRVNLEDFNGDKAYAKYSNFYIGDKSTNYKLTVNGYSGTAGDALKRHNDRAFSTKDKDNDTYSSENCAKNYKGAWWYYNCHVSNLNGLYVGNKKDDKGMRWSHWKGSQSMKTTSMMIRRKRL
ncbi:ryncolin-2-like isoform X1 [Mytilus edulis]|uniref:ryncolin-2-like isoform X1 n=1 Tax=Mytilus edulis TaxID=6550 RepID=UPI0039F029EB